METAGFVRASDPYSCIAKREVPQHLQQPSLYQVIEYFGQFLESDSRKFCLQIFRKAGRIVIGQSLNRYEKAFGDLEVCVSTIGLTVSSLPGLQCNGVGKRGPSGLRRRGYGIVLAK